MDQMRGFLKVGGWAGIVYAVLVVVSTFIVPAPPDSEAAISEVKAYMVDNRSGMLLQALLFALALPVLLFFLEALRRRFSTDAAAAPMAVVGALAGTLFYTVAVIASSMFAATGWNDDGLAALGDDAFRVTWNLGYLIYLTMFPLAALALLAAAWCAHRSGAFGTWYTVLSGIFGVALVAGSVAVVSSGLATTSFPAFLGFVLWVLVSGILLVRSGAETEPAAT